MCERLRGPGPHHGPHTQRETSHSHLARMLARSGHESRVRCVHACQPSVAAYFRFWYMIKSKSSRGSQVYMRPDPCWSVVFAGGGERARARARGARARRTGVQSSSARWGGWLAALVLRWSGASGECGERAGRRRARARHKKSAVFLVFEE